MTLTNKKAELLLMIIIAARATSFMFSKLCLTTMNTFSLISIRFLIASILLFVIFHKKIIAHCTKKTVSSGIIIGTLFFGVLTCEHTGLKTTDASIASFIENLAIIIVPFAELFIMRKKANIKIFLRAFIAALGVLMLSFANRKFYISKGEIFLFIAACLYATAIIVTSRLSKSGDPFVIGFFQVFTTGVLAFITSVSIGQFTLPSSIGQYLMVLALAIICTGFGFTLQPVAQSKVSSETAGAFCAIGPFTASVTSIIFLKEPVTLIKTIGGFSILMSLIIQ